MREAFNRPRGKPTLYPKQTAADFINAQVYLTKLGFKIIPTTSKDPNTFDIQTGSWLIHIAVGGTARAHQRSVQVVVYFRDMHGKNIVIKSACRSGRVTGSNVVDYIKASREKNWRQPCGSCGKCIAAKFITQVNAEYLKRTDPGLSAIHGISYQPRSEPCPSESAECPHPGPEPETTKGA